MESMTKMKTKVPTPEFPVTINDVKMAGYYVGGCCCLRSFKGLDTAKSPADVVEGIITCGVGGSSMILTDAYHDGKAATEFKEFVEEEKLGTVTIAPPIENPYTSKLIYTVTFNYHQGTLLQWLSRTQEKRGEVVWTTPDNWSDQMESVHMDDVFYVLGGGVKDSLG